MDIDLLSYMSRPVNFYLSLHDTTVPPNCTLEIRSVDQTKERKTFAGFLVLTVAYAIIRLQDCQEVVTVLGIGLRLRTKADDGRVVGDTVSSTLDFQLQCCGTRDERNSQMKTVLALIAWGALTAFFHTGSLASEPSVIEMIDDLRPRTRGLLRNIVPERNAKAEAPPSLSLQVSFDWDSTRLRGDSEASLEKLATAMRSPELEKSRFAIEGHTDATGNAAYNMKLSHRRAESVREFLMQQGVAFDRLVAKGKGGAEPANAADPSAPENRRVRIVNLD